VPCKNRAFLTVPFSGSTLGVRVGATAYNLAEAMAALVRGAHLPSLQFSSVDLAASNGTQVVAKSGVKVYTTLPVWNGTNLDTFCPGKTRPPLVIADEDPDKGENKNEGNKNDLDGWAIGLIVLLALATVGTVAFLLVVVNRERNGKPMFALAGDTEISAAEHC
jgi:hypothetical protein